MSFRRIGVATIFSDGFETGDLSAWTSYTCSSGCSIGASTSAKKHGNYGCRFTLACGLGGFQIAYARKDYGGGSEVYGRLYFRIASVTNWARTIDIFYGGYTGVNGAVLHCQTSGGAYQIRASTWDDVWAERSTGWGTAFSVGQWVCLETQWKKATGPGSNDGILRFWQNDVLVGELTNIDNDAKASPTAMRLDAENIATPFAATLDFDTVEIADTRIGMLRKYQIYDNSGLGLIDYATPRATVIDSATAWTSGALTFPATWRFGVRAANEYGEEKNLDVADELRLLESGNESPPRPNRPTSLAARPAASGKVEIIFNYDSTGEAAACTHFHVCYDGGSGQVDYANPVGSVAKDDGPITHYMFLSGALTSGVTYRFAVRAATASDVQDDGIESVAVTADADPPNQPASLSAEVVR
jgi:hypothetical protein